MNKQEVAALLTMITAVYPNSMNSSNKDLTFNLYVNYLEKYDASVIRANFDAYVLENRYPPTIADLTGGAVQDKVKQVTPNAQETKLYLESQEYIKQKVDEHKLEELKKQALDDIAKGASLNKARSSNKGVGDNEWY